MRAIHTILFGLSMGAVFGRLVLHNEPLHAGLAVFAFILYLVLLWEVLTE